MEEAVEGFIDYLKAEQNRSDNTVESYRRDIERFRVWLAEERELTRPERVRARTWPTGWWRWTRRTSVASHFAHARTSVRQLFKFLMKEGRVEADPTLPYAPRSSPRRCRRC